MSIEPNKANYQAKETERGERVGASPGNPLHNSPVTDYQPWGENLATQSTKVRYRLNLTRG